MALSILNNIAALYAENNLTSTQSSLQNTLQQLSSGSRINSGADDAAGLAVANGLGANEAALTQSAQNATSGIGLLQTAAARSLRSPTCSTARSRWRRNRPTERSPEAR